MTTQPPPAKSVPCSVFLITKDEAARLPRTLAALAWAEEIVVVDSGSTDGTQAIAEAAGAAVHHRDWEGYGPQKAYAEGLCRHDWVVNLDADEVVTPALAAEIAKAVAGEPALWRVRILTVYPGDTAPRPFAADYDVVRIYHRSVGRYRAHPLYDRVEPVGEAPERRFSAPVHHFPFISWAHLVEKENRYSSFAASQARPRARAGLMARLVVEGPWVFLKFWFLKRHFTGGWKGFAFAGVVAFARWLRVVKLLDRRPRGAAPKK